MSVATLTVLPRPARFPTLLPPTPRVLPQPLPKKSSYGHLKAHRDLQKELEDLSEEEIEVEEMNTAIHTRGYSYLVPIGRSLTQKEEKADAGESGDDDGPDSTDGDEDDEEEEEEEEEEPEEDMDADLEDLDGDPDVPEDVEM